jgi:hypothetical protein
LLAKQPIIVGMGSDPEPHEVAAGFDSESTMVDADSRRPEPADLLEVQ